MGISKTLGGERLGSGKKNKVHMSGFERSTHDLSYRFDNTQAPGTLVPFMVEVMTPGDTFDIDLETAVLTHPTVGPLFGSFKLQLDIFTCPIRLYQAQLHNNKLGIGRDMSKVKLPQMLVEAKNPRMNEKGIPIDVLQIHPASLLRYLGVTGVGTSSSNLVPTVKREFNAVPLLAYWDIYKNYYANKQEEIGAYINTNDVSEFEIRATAILNADGITWNTAPQEIKYGQKLRVQGAQLQPEYLIMTIAKVKSGVIQESKEVTLEEIARDIEVRPGSAEITAIFNYTPPSEGEWTLYPAKANEDVIDKGGVIGVKTFPLSNLDDMREDILAAVKQTSPFMIDEDSPIPYSDSVRKIGDHAGDDLNSASSLNQQCLGLKTYQSDIFNNWLSTEWIDGVSGVTAVSAIDVSSGLLKMDALIMQKKIYNMLNRIVISGGTYNDWIEVTHDVDVFGMIESPVYMGGLSQEIEFQQVVSNAASENEPLGTLGGKGTLSQRKKGGKVVVKATEHQYIIGIVSITPRISYSQGNKWDTNLKTMNDFHKPNLDGIGFQELITDQMAYWETTVDNTGKATYRSAGKQPSWINYMTNYDRAYGNFADERNEMFMTLNRKYEVSEGFQIKDLTTYIDPRKYNYAFAQTDLNAMNFWVLIQSNIEARRKMSAKQIPNL